MNVKVIARWATIAELKSTFSQCITFPVRKMKSVAAFTIDNDLHLHNNEVRPEAFAVYDYRLHDIARKETSNFYKRNEMEKDFLMFRNVSKTLSFS